MGNNIKLSSLKGIKNLDELSKYDNIIRTKCKTMIKCPDTADDIVNDMYLKISSVFERGESIGGDLVFITMKNLITDFYRKNRKFDFGNSIYPSTMPEKEDYSYDDIKHKLHQEKLYEEIERRKDNLHWYEKAVLEFSEDHNLLELSRQTGISYRSLNYTKTKINEKLGIVK